MKVQIITKKMVLNKVSIANLSKDQMVSVKGGDTQTCGLPTNIGEVCHTIGLLVCIQTKPLP